MVVHTWPPPPSTPQLGKPTYRALRAGMRQLEIYLNIQCMDCNKTNVFIYRCALFCNITGVFIALSSHLFYLLRKAFKKALPRFPYLIFYKTFFFTILIIFAPLSPHPVKISALRKVIIIFLYLGRVGSIFHPCKNMSCCLFLPSTAELYYWWMVCCKER